MQKITSNPASMAAALLAVSLVLVVAIVDLMTGVGFNGSIIYPTLLLACFFAKNRRFLWLLTVCCLLANLSVALYTPDDARAYRHRGIAAVALLATATTLHVLINAWIRSRRDQRILETNHAELSARESEIARQNEELLSQTEELERQSEELRVINDELAGRERLLAALLDLSRSLSAELTEDQVMARVCDALGGLINGRASAAAILFRDDDRIVVRCHAGFGAQGLKTEQWAFDRSFSSLIIAQGQAGYLEDLALRSDLEFPRSNEDLAFQSVLAAPLRVHGRLVGTLEAYSRERQRWSSEQISLVESLAAQTSISLETAHLFQEIERQRQRFETVLRTLPVGVLVADDPQCLMVRGNPAAAAMYNAPADANFSPFAPVESRIRRTVVRNGQPVSLDSHPLLRCVRGGSELRGEEWDVLFPDGRRISLLTSAAPIFDAQGGIVGGVCAFADITALKHIEQELDRRRREAEEISARKTRFLAAVSHDIRTPANAISLLAELIQRSSGNASMADGIPELARDLRASAVSLVELVSDVLDVARLDFGKIDLQESEFALDEAIAEEVRRVLPLAREKSLELVEQPIDPPIHLRADRVKLGRVIGNLLGNAIKFTERGQVTVRAGIDSDRSVRIEVIDTGIGISPEHLPHIFDEFFQLRNPERNQIKGTGLGLTICKRLVDAMGGSLEAHSETGRGSTFTVLLPAGAVASAPTNSAQDGADPPASLGASDVDLKQRRVLLVEDHPSTRRAVAMMLRSRGAIVVEAEDVRGALAELGRFRPHVLLLDMMLPDQDGEEVLKVLQSDRPEQLECVLVLTGDATAQRLGRVRRLGADAVITKPVDFDHLLETIKQCRSALDATVGNGD